MSSVRIIPTNGPIVWLDDSPSNLALLHARNATVSIKGHRFFASDVIIHVSDEAVDLIEVVGVYERDQY